MTTPSVGTRDDSGGRMRDGGGRTEGEYTDDATLRSKVQEHIQSKSKSKSNLQSPIQSNHSCMCIVTDRTNVDIVSFHPHPHPHRH